MLSRYSKFDLSRPAICAALLAAPVALAGSTQPFPENPIDPGPNTTAQVGDGPNAIWAADLDGDMRIDVITAWITSDEIVWYRNLGGAPPTFQEYALTNPGAGIVAESATWVIADDNDNDGDMDIFAVSRGDDKIVWWENNPDDLADPLPDDRFVQRIITRALDPGMNQVQGNTDTPRVVRLADIDNADGDKEVVFCSRRDGSVGYFPTVNGVPPEFTDMTPDPGPVPIYIARDPSKANGIADPVVDAPVSLDVGDINGDTFIDIVVAARDDNIVWIFLNDGMTPPSFNSFQLETAPMTPAVFDEPVWVELAHLNADMALDILVCSSENDKIAWYANDGAAMPAFTENIVTIDPVMNDVGTEGFLDDPRFATAADIDGDGDTDIISGASDEGTVAWFENTGVLDDTSPIHVITEYALSSRAAFLADLDDDNDLDVLSGSSQDDELSWFGLSVPAAENLNTLQTYNCIADAIDDASSSDVIRVAEEAIDAEPTIDYDGKQVTLESRGKFDQPSDGDYTLTDGAMLSAATGEDVLLDADTTVSPSAMAGILGRAVILGADGLLDVEQNASAMITSVDRAVLGGATFARQGAMIQSDALVLGGLPPSFETEVTVSTSKSQPRSVASADFDADGDLDAVVAFFGEGEVNWYENLGGSPPMYASAALVGAFGNVRALIAQDLDGDGDPDIAAVGENTPEVAWYENNGDATATFTERAITNSLTQPRAIAAGFIDDDADIDLVISDLLGVRWYKADAMSASGFTEQAAIDSSVLTEDVIVADLNADGVPDVIACSANDDDVVFFENDGGATPYSGATVTSTIASGLNNPSSISAGDIDADGMIDVVYAESDGGAISWSRNLGGDPPTFAIQGAINPTAPGASDIVAKDVDGDGDTDVVATIADTDLLAWYESTGGAAPSFTERIIDDAFEGAAAAAVDDVDNDGDRDILAAAADGNATTLFAAAGADVRSQLIIESDAFTLPNESYSQTPFTLLSVERDQTSLPIETPALSVGGPSASSASISGGFQFLLDPALDPNTLVEGDRFNILGADAIEGRFGVSLLPALPGNLGLIVRSENIVARGGPATVFVSVEDLGEVNFGSAEETTVPEGLPASAAVGDFDGVNGLDLALAIPSADSVIIFRNAGTIADVWQGFITPAVQIALTPGREPVAIAAGNLDNNPGLDLVVANQAADNVTLLLNQSTGDAQFAIGIDIPVGDMPTGVAVENLNNEGVDDIVVTNAGSSDTISYIPSSGGGYGAPQSFAAGDEPEFVCPSDVDGDKDADVLASNFGSNTLSLLINDGSGNLTPAPALGVGQGPKEAAFADFNGDGRIDVAVANSTNVMQPDGSLSGEVSVLLNTTPPGGAPSFAPAVQLPIGDTPTSIIAVDWDLDGDPDIAVLAAGEGVVKVLRNNTSPDSFSEVSFSLTEDPSIMGVPQLLTAGDVDGDGDDDLIAVGGQTLRGELGAVSVTQNDLQLPCPADLTGDGVISAVDIAELLSFWGPCAGSCAADLSGDGMVSAVDLAELISFWGPCDP